ncbi:ABA4-like family protein [Aurantivibrio plasticivorans]
MTNLLPPEAGLFELFNTIICVPWAVLIFAPHYSRTRWVAQSIWLPLLLLSLWLMLKLAKPPKLDGAGIFSFSGFQLLLTSPYTSTLLWLQVLIWDFILGTWIVRDAKRCRIRHLWTVPALVLTFISGPLGLILYYVQRTLLTRSFTLEETAANPRLNS